MYNQHKPYIAKLKDFKGNITTAIKSKTMTLQIHREINK